MNVSESAGKIREMIEKAMDDHKITRKDYDLILHKASEDGFIDPQEQALLTQLHDMIEDRSVKIVP
jgi:hypothetical protein